MKLHATLSHPQIDLLPEGGESDDIRLQIWGLLTYTLPQNEHELEQRRETRLPVPISDPPFASR